jgi:hypothetical protein
MKNFIRFIYAISISSAMDVYRFIAQHLVNVSAHALGWVVIVMLHMAAFPTLFSVLTGASDKLPPVDIMVFIWASLTTMFVKALLEKDRLYLTTICAGFIAQTVTMGIILFK